MNSNNIIYIYSHRNKLSGKWRFNNNIGYILQYRKPYIKAIHHYNYITDQLILKSKYNVYTTDDGFFVDFCFWVVGVLNFRHLSEIDSIQEAQTVS